MAKDLDIKIEEAHERVLRRIGDVFGQRIVIGAVCPVNKFDARNVKNYTFIVKCSVAYRGNVFSLNYKIWCIYYRFTRSLRKHKYVIQYPVSVYKEKFGVK